MPLQNTLELAKQGDPTAISTILSYYLTQRYNVTASVIRLGDYLSVLVEADISPDPPTLATLIRSIIQDLSIDTVNLVEINARKIGDRNVLWSQTIELDRTPLHTFIMSDPTPTIASLSSSTFSAAAASPAAVSPATPTSPGSSSISAAASSSNPDSDFQANPALVPSSPASLPLATPSEELTLSSFLQRPEMLALVAFALVLLLWEAYTKTPTELDPSQAISGSKLARRLGVHSSTLSRYKTRPNFSEWSQDLDPDHIAWNYDGTAFLPKIA
jgi:hypothetical protein